MMPTESTQTPGTLAILVVVWMGASLGTGAVLAAIARRIHPRLSYPRLWVFYSVLMSFLVGLVFALGWW